MRTDAGERHLAFAGLGLSLRWDSGLTPLVRAFPGPSIKTASDSHLDLSLEVDPVAVARILADSQDCRQHLRLGNRHLWRSRRPGQVQMLDLTGSARGRFLLPDPLVARVPVIARPAVDAISAWAARCGRLPLHASAAARDGRAFVFIGPGGRGKTTTAIALAQRGWRLIADDRCFLEMDTPYPIIHGLYRTLMLHQDSVCRLGLSAGSQFAVSHEGKVVQHWPDGFGQPPAAPIHGVIAVGRGTEPPYGLRRLRPREVLRVCQEALGPCVQALGPSALIVRTMSRLSGTVPFWSLSLGWDLDRLENRLSDLLERSVVTVGCR